MRDQINNNNLTRRDFLKLGVAPFFISKDDKNSKNTLIISPKNSYISTINIKIRSYKIFLNQNQTYGVDIEAKERLPFDHCNYNFYNNLVIVDKSRNKTLFFDNIYFRYADIKGGRVFNYGYDFGEKYLEINGIFV